MDYIIVGLLQSSLSYSYFDLPGFIIILSIKIYKLLLWLSDKNDSRMLEEFKWGAATGLTYFPVMLIIYYLYKNGFTLIYFERAEYGFAYYLVSGLLLFVIQDAYFRSSLFMHMPPLEVFLPIISSPVLYPLYAAAFSVHPESHLLN